VTDVTDAVGEAFAQLLGHPAVGLAIRFLALYVLILWLASAWWVWRDARARTTDVIVPYLAAGAVLLVTPVLFPLAVAVYRLVRPPLTVAAATSAELQLAMLEEEAAQSVCARCGASVDEEWVACPACGSPLAVRCDSCGRALELDWTICAWCAAEVPWAEQGPAEPRGIPEDAIAIPIRPGGRPLLPVMAIPEQRAGAAGPPAARRRAGRRRSGA
jgi:hypothetical protein